MLVLTLRGTPFLFQGEELGLTDVPVPAERIVDVDGRDPERAPIPWEPPSAAGPGAGFSTGEPWLPVHPDAERLAASVQAQDDASFLAFYRELLRLRAATPALHAGTYRSLSAAADVFAFVREHDGRRVLVALNFAPFARPLPAEAAGGRMLLSSRGGALQPTELAGDEGRIVELA